MTKTYSPQNYIGGAYPEEGAPEEHEDNPAAPEREPQRRRPSWGVDADGDWFDDCPGFRVGE